MTCADDSTLKLLGLCGFSGAALMFVADLILYLPHELVLRSGDVYFSRIDAAAPDLQFSTMADISDARLRLGGLLGPIAASLYAVGFIGVFLALAGGGGWGAEGGSEGVVGGLVLPLVASGGLAAMMIVGGTYHALFAYTGFLAASLRRESQGAASPIGASVSTRGVIKVLFVQHRAYLAAMHRAAALFGLLGSAAFAWCILCGAATGSRYVAQLPVALLTPGLSALSKRGVRALRLPAPYGLVVAGGWTNLWNGAFFAVSTALLVPGGCGR